MMSEPTLANHPDSTEILTTAKPAGAEPTYRFDVKMTCSGCSNAVTRVLNKAKLDGGVSDFSVDLATQEVLVTGAIPYDQLLEKIKKTGKEVRSGSKVD